MKRASYHELAVFAAVAEHGSIARAAAAIGLSASQVSRTLARVEGRLAVQLVHRTTRRLVLTEEGRALYARIRPSFTELDEAEAAVGSVGETPRGRLRVTLPVLLGHRFVASVATRFAAENPLVAVELVFDDRKVDLVAEGFDLGVRVGLGDDPSLVARRLAATRILTVASPAYVDRAGTPEHPNELGAHDVLIHAREEATGTWFFEGPDGPTTVRFRPSRFLASSGAALRDATLAGLGIARLPGFLVGEDVADGRLVRVLAPWEYELPIAAVYPPVRHLSPKVRQFVDLLVREFARLRWC